MSAGRLHAHTRKKHGFFLYRLFQIHNVRFLRRKVDKAAKTLQSTIQPSISAACALPLHNRGPKEHFLASLSLAHCNFVRRIIVVIFDSLAHDVSGSSTIRLTFNFQILNSPKRLVCTYLDVYVCLCVSMSTHSQIKLRMYVCISMRVCAQSCMCDRCALKLLSGTTD